MGDKFWLCSCQRGLFHPAREQGFSFLVFYVSDSYLIVKGPNSPLQCHMRKFNRPAWSSELKCEMKVFS